MKKIILSILTVLSFISMHAQEIPAKEAPQVHVSQEVAALRLATELVKYGYAQQSALPLIDALQILSEIPIQALDASKVGEAVIDSVAVEKKSKISFDYQSILADAKRFADGDANLLAIIDNIDADAKGATRGNVNGPSRDYAAVYANSHMDYTANFIADRVAEVLVSGDGDTDLDLYVYDSNGNLIARDNDYTDDCYVRWVPAWTGRYTIRIVNRGPVYNRFVILTN